MTVADKKKSANKQLSDIGFLGELWQQVRLVFYLIKDGDVPIYLKILPLLGILYTLFPIDLITDVIPILGQLDDLTILLIGAKVFIEMAPPQVVARYMAAMRGEAAPTIVEGTASDATSPDNEKPVLLIQAGDEATDLKAAETAQPARRGRFFGRR
jgi:uncharacterized membrane protein YkvA (DUF1232 family)